MKINSTISLCLTGVSIIAFGLGTVPAVSGAEPKSVAKSTSKPSNEAPPPEIPAVPYVTLGLVRDPAVHAELKLDQKQIDAVQAAIAEVDEPLWRLRDVPVSKCKKQLDELLVQLQASLNRELNLSQIERFEQIVLQVRSWKAVVTPEVAESLKLSRDQISRLRTLLANVASTRVEAEKKLAGVPVADQETARNKLLKAETKQFTDVLTEKQQNRLGILLGEPFDLGRVTPVGCMAPELRDVSAWINSSPMSLEKLRGKVVVVHFWAFGCVNCLRNLPHYQVWQEKYAKSGLTIIGIHTPETAAERSLENLKRQVIERKIEYPVVFDTESSNWKAWGNDVWPSVYLIDKQGRVRYWWYGELNWNGASGEELFTKRIEGLLAEK